MSLLFLLLTLVRPPCYGDTSPMHDVRNSKTKVYFFLAHPCPGGPDKGSKKRCQGYVIDHVCPLQCCGPDAVSNMQWQTVEEGKVKDKWERDCQRSCHKQ